MIGTEWEEQQKDKILQRINDELENLQWGGSSKKLAIKIIFDGKFNMRPIKSFQSDKVEDTPGESDVSKPRPMMCYQ